MERTELNAIVLAKAKCCNGNQAVKLFLKRMQRLIKLSKRKGGKRMNKSQGKKEKSITIAIFSSLLLLLIFSMLLLSCRSSEPSEEYKKNSPSAKRISVFISDISPDGKTLLFEYGTPYWSKIGTFNIETDKVQTFDNDKSNKMIEAAMFSSDGSKISYTAGSEKGSPQNICIMNADGKNVRQITYDIQIIGGAYFSPDGQKVSFLARKKKNEPYNIYIVNIDGSNLKQLTTDKNVKGVPSFSPDDKRIIYKRSHLRRQRAYPLKGEMDTAWDAYEFDLETNTERRLTNYNFYTAHNPRYMSDGKHFLFTAEGPVNSTGKGPKNFQEYEKMYQKNFILIMDGENNELKPAFTNGNNSISTHKSADDSILFTSEITEKNSSKRIQELFLYKAGKIKRLTKFGDYIRGGGISRDGSVIYFRKYDDQKSYIKSLWLMKSDGTELREIKIPVDDLKE